MKKIIPQLLFFLLFGFFIFCRLYVLGIIVFFLCLYSIVALLVLISVFHFFSKRFTYLEKIKNTIDTAYETAILYMWNLQFFELYRNAYTDCCKYIAYIKKLCTRREKIDVENLFLTDLNSLYFVNKRTIEQAFVERFGKRWGLPHITFDVNKTSKTETTIITVSTNSIDPKGKASKWKKVGKEPFILEPKTAMPSLRM